MVSENDGSRHFKYDRANNKTEKVFPPKLFSVAPIVLIRTDEDEYYEPEVFWVSKQSKKDDRQTVERVELPEDFSVPKKAKKISKEKFEELAGDDW